MNTIFIVGEALLGLYRERGFDPRFWAEPLNAVSNASFLIATASAWVLVNPIQKLKPTTGRLLMVSGTIGLGSFCFHTIPNHFTMWLDIIPIALFQVLFLWYLAREVATIRRAGAVLIIVGVVGTALALLPFKEPLNGSLFYLPPLLALGAAGSVWYSTRQPEPHLLLVATAFFLVAVIARSVDWLVPWQFGTHFLWHALNGGVIYLLLRAAILPQLASDCNSQEIDEGQTLSQSGSASQT